MVNGYDVIWGERLSMEERGLYAGALLLPGVGGRMLTKADDVASLAAKSPGPSGLRDASAGLKKLFSEGSIRDRSIIGIRSDLMQHGFASQIRVQKGQGYLFQGPGGEFVRIMRRKARTGSIGWDIRVQNRHGAYLDGFGNVGPPNLTHVIAVWSR